MKLLAYNLFCLPFLFAARAVSAGALDCEGVDISRAGDLPNIQDICTHFGGVDPEGYHQWYDSNDISTKYPNLVYIPGADPNKPENGAAIHWKVDGDFVHLAVAARATGWLGFGIAEAGGMLGADMAIFTASRPNEIVDAYTSDWRQPQTDDCSNNWELVSSLVDTEGGFLMFEVKRLLNTGDPQDKVIVNDALYRRMTDHACTRMSARTPAIGDDAGPHTSLL
jgi:hypothetical protein